MAWLSDLVAALADVTGIPEPTVAQIARHVREDGLISSGGRGRSAAKMTAEDCASLLIPLMIADQAKNASEYVRKSMRLYREADIDRKTRKSRWPNTHAEGDGGDRFSFHRDLAWLIDQARSGVFEDECRSGGFKGMSMHVSASRPLWHASIYVTLYGDDLRERKDIVKCNYTPVTEIREASSTEINSAAVVLPALRIDATVDERVIVALSDVIGR